MSSSSPSSPPLTYSELFTDTAYPVVHLNVRQAVEAQAALQHDWPMLLTQRLVQDVLLEGACAFVGAANLLDSRNEDAPLWYIFLADAMRMLLEVGVMTYEFATLPEARGGTRVPLLLHGRLGCDYVMAANRITLELNAARPFVVVRPLVPPARLHQQYADAAPHGIGYEIDWRAYAWHGDARYAPDPRTGDVRSVGKEISGVTRHYLTALQCDEMASMMMCNPMLVHEESAGHRDGVPYTDLALTETDKRERERMQRVSWIGDMHDAITTYERDQLARGRDADVALTRWYNPLLPRNACAPLPMDTLPSPHAMRMPDFRVPTGRHVVHQVAPRAPPNLTAHVQLYREFVATAFGVPLQIATGDFKTYTSTRRDSHRADFHGATMQYVQTLRAWEFTLGALIGDVMQQVLGRVVEVRFESLCRRRLLEEMTTTMASNASEAPRAEETATPKT